MRKIEALDRKLKPLSQRELKAGTVPTLRDVLIDSVGRRKPENPRQSIAFFKLTDKIIQASGILEVEDIEYQTIKESVEDNPSGYFPYYHGQVMEILK